MARTKLKYLNCEVLKVCATAALLDDAGCVLIVGANLNRFVLDQVRKGLQTVLDGLKFVRLEPC